MYAVFYKLKGQILLTQIQECNRILFKFWTIFSQRLKSKIFMLQKDPGPYSKCLHAASLMHACCTLCTLTLTLDACLMRTWCVLNACLKRAWCVLDASLMCAWCVLDARLMRAWCVLDACSMRAWCMLDACLMRAWCVLDACLMRAWCVLDACLMRAWCVLDACLMLAWNMLDVCLIRAWCVLGLYLLLFNLCLICLMHFWISLQNSALPEGHLYMPMGHLPVAVNSQIW